MSRKKEFIEYEALIDRGMNDFNLDLDITKLIRRLRMHGAALTRMSAKT